MTLSEFKAWFNGMETILSRADLDTFDMTFREFMAEIKDKINNITNDYPPLPFVKTPLTNMPNADQSFTEEEINRYRNNANKMTQPAVVDPFLNSKMPNTWNEIRLSDKKPPVII